MICTCLLSIGLRQHNKIKREEFKSKLLKVNLSRNLNIAIDGSKRMSSLFQIHFL